MCRLTHLMFGLIMLTSLVLVSCSDVQHQETLDRIVTDMKAKLAPDLRVSICDVKGELVSGQVELTGEVLDASMRTAIERAVKEKVFFPIENKIRVLPEKDLGPAANGVVSVSVANIRTSPSHEAELSSQVLMGTPVRYIKRKQGWTLVQLPDKYLGWTDDNIAPLVPSEYANWIAAPKVIVISRSAWVRSSPDKHSMPVGDAVAGCLLAYAGEERGSHIVKFPDGRQGYLDPEDGAIYRDWLARTKESEQSVVQWAQQLMGAPYLWGGTSTKAMDGSGFVKTVYFMNGIMLPRDADRQMMVGDAVAMNNGQSDLRPGDLLFFGMNDIVGKPPRVTHVGVSIGGSHFIHASGYVRVNSLDPGESDYSAVRAQTFLGARRIIGSMESSGIKHLSSIAEYR
jgi:gamma-D-glutamyl-L-lysine dipeptidyl-peptidase